MRDDGSNCSTVTTRLSKKSTALNEYLKSQQSFSRSTFELAEYYPKINETVTDVGRMVCKIWTIRGLFSSRNRTETGGFSRDWFLLPFAKEGPNLVIELFDIGKNESRSVSAPSKQSDPCETTSSCKQFKRFSFVPGFSEENMSVFGYITKQYIVAAKLHETCCKRLSRTSGYLKRLYPLRTSRFFFFRVSGHCFQSPSLKCRTWPLCYPL